MLSIVKKSKVNHSSINFPKLLITIKLKEIKCLNLISRKKIFLTKRSKGYENGRKW